MFELFAEITAFFVLFIIIVFVAMRIFFTYFADDVTDFRNRR